MTEPALTDAGKHGKRSLQPEVLADRGHLERPTRSICDGAKGGAYSNFSFQYGCVTVPPLPIR
ncbi:MAG TPA: hypothetical protein VH062_28520 [Polyangiaceae bacterium]|nr:hypothetical protein [Polyangiaceae bacterium]